jgi:hypothetical protein
MMKIMKYDNRSSSLGSNAVMSSTMTGLKSGTCMGVLDYDFSGGIYFSLPLENDLNWLYDSPCVREPACLPVGKSAFGACGEPDSVKKNNRFEEFEGSTRVQRFDKSFIV